MGEPPVQPELVHGIRERKACSDAFLGGRTQRVLDLALNEEVLLVVESEALLVRRCPAHFPHVIGTLAG
jgi:hypothetical protein